MLQHPLTAAAVVGVVELGLGLGAGRKWEWASAAGGEQRWLHLHELYSVVGMAAADGTGTTGLVWQVEYLVPPAVGNAVFVVAVGIVVGVVVAVVVVAVVGIAVVGIVVVGIVVVGIAQVGCTAALFVGTAVVVVDTVVLTAHWVGLTAAVGQTVEQVVGYGTAQVGLTVQVGLTAQVGLTGRVGLTGQVGQTGLTGLAGKVECHLLTPGQHSQSRTHSQTWN